MRVTQKQMTDAVTYQLFKQTRQLMNAQMPVATGKRINKPSDDPSGMGSVLNYRRTLGSIAQYQRNISQADVRLKLSETTLNGASELLNTAKNIAGDHANGQRPLADRQIAAEQIDNIRRQLVDLANMKNGDVYIFGGRATNSPPFTLDSVTDVVSYNGDNSANADARVMVGENVEVSIKANGQEIFMGVEDMFALLKDIKDELALAVPNTAIIQDRQTRLFSALDQLQGIRSQGATTANRIEASNMQLDRFEMTIQDLLAGIENADPAEAIVTLKAQETAYETTLQSAARIIQPNLLKFLG